jgi:hypothetical protein
MGACRMFHFPFISTLLSFEVQTTLDVVMVLGYVRPYIMVHEYQKFGGTRCLYLQDGSEKRVKQRVRNAEERRECWDQCCW